MKKISHFIDGKIYSDSKSRIGPIFNPAIGEQIAEVELASKSTVEMAIESSSKAFQKWSKTTPINRARILAKFKDLLIKNMNDLAVMVSEQHGKTIADAKGSIQRGIEVVEYAASLMNVPVPKIEAFDIAAKNMTPMALSFWQENRRVSNQLLCNQLGYSLMHPNYESGLEDCFLQSTK